MIYYITKGKRLDDAQQRLAVVTGRGPGDLDDPTMWPAHVAAGSRGDVLPAILAPDINLAVWERLFSPSLADAIASLDLTRFTEARLVVAPQEVEAALLDFAQEQIGGGGLIALAADVAMLVRRFSDLLGLPVVDVRLERIVTDACRRYHADYVPIRLICTYRGPGTEWLTNDVASSLAAGVEPASVSPRRLATGHVGLFKGRDASEHPIVHRSPPIAMKGVERLLLVINPVPGGADSAE